jgi:hypothetical protein
MPAGLNWLKAGKNVWAFVMTEIDIRGRLYKKEFLE